MKHLLFRNSRASRSIAAIIVLAGMGCLLFTESAAHFTGFTALSERSEALIDASIAKNMLTFGTISGIKAILALLEGSSVGVGFDLEVGDLVQPAYDYVDFIWKFMLYALMILGLYKLLMETGILMLGLKVVGIGLLLLGAAFVFPQWRQGLMAWAKRLTGLGLLIAYVVPVTLILTHWLSVTYTDPIQENYRGQIGSLYQRIQSARDEFLALKDEISLTNPSQSLSLAKDRCLRMAGSITDAVWDTMFAFIHLILIVFFELFVFPLLSAFLLYRAIQFALGRLLEGKPAPIKQASQAT